MTSLEPLIGVPGVRVACEPLDVPEMWKLLTDISDEMMDRHRAVKADPTREFPIKLVIMDEINMFAQMSSAIWKTMKEKGDPATPPIWGKIASILWTGRSVNCHLIAVGQRLDDKATGGIGLRDSLGLRGLAGYRKNQWDMLIGSMPMQRSQKPKGRWIYSDGQTETWVQNVYAAPKLVRDYAMHGRHHSAMATPELSGHNERQGS